ncbi:MAG: aminoglycoside phosphotransferase family protein [Candidatus Neptunochlamydia sp.]|nr:aminoglycoside phosphotransferase family protein [Candidatus Neptunochlamydia sp.]
MGYGPMNGLNKNIISISGKEGKQWLDSLPEITAKIADEHNLSDLTPVNNMTFNYIASGYQNDKPIILKIGMNSKALAKEASCLKAFTKHAAAEVIAYDNNIIIMQRSVPGSTLKDHFPDNDEEATKILCASIKELHKASIPENHNFYHLSELFKALDQELDIPDKILTKAKHLRDELLSTTTKEVLLHGDLHHDNILQNGDGWLVIDPKGFIGDPAFEPAAYLCNPIPELLHEDNAKQIVSDRIKLCAEKLGLPEQRITDWLYAKSVLCWAWSLDDNLDSSYWKKYISFIN